MPFQVLFPHFMETHYRPGDYRGKIKKKQRHGAQIPLCLIACPGHVKKIAYGRQCEIRHSHHGHKLQPGNIPVRPQDGQQQVPQIIGVFQHKKRCHQSRHRYQENRISFSVFFIIFFQQKSADICNCQNVADQYRQTSPGSSRGREIKHKTCGQQSIFLQPGTDIIQQECNQKKHKKTQTCQAHLFPQFQYDVHHFPHILHGYHFSHGNLE